MDKKEEDQNKYISHDIKEKELYSVDKIIKIE